jgi:hypothetical protein
MRRVVIPRHVDELQTIGRGWLRLMRDGTPEQSAHARTELGLVFERLEMPELAIEAYLGNVRRRVRDKHVYERLANLYIACGEQDLARRIENIGERLTRPLITQPYLQETCLLCGDIADMSCPDCAPKHVDILFDRAFLHCCCRPTDVVAFAFTGSTRFEDIGRKRTYFRERGWMFDDQLSRRSARGGGLARFTSSASIWSATVGIVLFTGLLTGASVGPMIAVLFDIVVHGVLRETHKLAAILSVIVFITVLCVFLVAWVQMRRAR